MKKGKKRIIAGELTILMISGGLCHEVSADPCYTDDERKYSIEQILSDYQYFTEGDLTSDNHTVGAVAVGGDANIGSYGAGAVVPSFINNIENVGDYQSGHYFRNQGKFENYIGKEVYYISGTPDKYNTEKGLYKKGIKYIDFETAFEKITSESVQFDKDDKCTNRLGENDIIGTMEIHGVKRNVLRLLFSSSIHTITIPKELYTKCDVIMISGITLKDVVDTQYVINIENKGVNIGCCTDNLNQRDSKQDNIKEDELTLEDLKKDGINPEKLVFLECKEGYQEVKPSGKNSSFTGTNAVILDHGHGLFQLQDGKIAGGQINVKGMKLIWNMPNALYVKATFLPGHVVAPKAIVDIAGGNFEGGIIGKTINAKGPEAHYYPFNKLDPSSGKSSEAPSKAPSETPSPTISVTPTPSSVPPTPVTEQETNVHGNNQTSGKVEVEYPKSKKIEKVKEGKYSKSNTAPSQDGVTYSGTTSPKTGEENGMLWFIVIGTCAGGVIVFCKKKKMI